MKRPIYTQLRHLHAAPRVVHLDCADGASRVRFLLFALVVALRGRGELRYGDIEHPVDSRSAAPATGS